MGCGASAHSSKEEVSDAPAALGAGVSAKPSKEEVYDAPAAIGCGVSAQPSKEEVSDAPAAQLNALEDNRFEKHNGYISKGGDLLVQTMDLELATKKALELDGCRGFCFRGTLTQAARQPTEFLFKNKFDNAISQNQWTSYKICIASASMEQATATVEAVACKPSAGPEQEQQALLLPKDVEQGNDEDAQPSIDCVVGKSSNLLRHCRPALSPGLSVPSYWHNTVDALEKGFDEKYQVPAERWAFLQSLLHDTAGSPAWNGDEVMGTKRLQIVEALRMEDSDMWLQYDAARTEMGKLRRRCTRPADIDTGGPSGDKQVRTERLIEESAERKQAAATLLANLNADINEVYLWHGTSRAAWSAIADDGFILKEDGGGRYGPGIYFAEDSTMSLRFAPVHDKQQALLLCRVVLGEPYYTQQSSNSSATTRLAKGDGKDSTLAHPAERWAREFIVFKVEQVYPEYALIVEAD